MPYQGVTRLAWLLTVEDVPINGKGAAVKRAGPKRATTGAGALGQRPIITRRMSIRYVPFRRDAPYRG
jgi:hypothetical protein